MNAIVVQLFFSVEIIDDLPLANSPDVFGLHPNAEIGYYTQAVKEMWTVLIELQPQTGKPKYFHWNIQNWFT